MGNARFDESQSGIKIAGRNIKNLRYADDTTLMEENKEKLKSLLINIQKTKIMASSPITSWRIEGEKVEAVVHFLFWGSIITGDSDCSLEIKRCLLLGRKAMTNLGSVLKSKASLCRQRSV